MLKLSDNPPVCQDLVRGITGLAGRWHVVHTRARCEKAVAWELYRAGMEYFLPMTDRFTLSGGKKRHGRLPLVPSYVFINGDENARQRVLESSRVCRVIRALDQKSLAAELSAIERAISARLRCEPVGCPAGQACRITRGPLCGIAGLFSEVSTGWTDRVNVVLPLSMLGLGVQVELDSACVAAVAPSEVASPILQLNRDTLLERGEKTTGFALTLGT